MSSTAAAGGLRQQLRKTWSPFFARHGSLTEVQRLAIGAILAGRDCLVMAATASGKTEAVLAPVLERLLRQGSRQSLGLRILYVCPTRALVRDLFERLRGPMDDLGVTMAMKTGDTSPVSVRRPPSLLITTPESLDALLTRAPRLLTSTQALIIDEVHLLDGTVRGDQLRCLLARILHIREHHHLAAIKQDGSHDRIEDGGAEESSRKAGLQRICLSATVANPAGVAARYLTDPVLIRAAGQRSLDAELQRMNTLSDLADAMSVRSARKTLLFCNTRREVEQVAAYLRQRLAYEAPVFTHYSNLDPGLRLEVEKGFAAAAAAVCVSSSTLELGIDIGSIDDVVLLGAPPNLSSFLQRVGRGGRRAQANRALCLARNPAEELRFTALLDAAQGSPEPVREEGNVTTGTDGDDSSSLAVRLDGPVIAAGYHFKLSVLVQQVFSLLKQSPTGGLRLADLRRLAPAAVADETLTAMLTQLVASGHLRPARPGEWRPAETLAVLADAHQIYSNIGDDSLGTSVIDAFSGRRLARADRPRRPGDVMMLGGRQAEVAWRAAYSFGVRPTGVSPIDEQLAFRTAPFAIPLELTQAMAAQLGLHPGQLSVVHLDGETWLFHFWGQIYGILLVALLRRQLTAEEFVGPIDAIDGICVRLPQRLDSLPPWDDLSALEEACQLAPRLERYLELGRFQDLLPPDLRLDTVLAALDLDRLASLYQSAVLVAAPAPLGARLMALREDGWE